MRALVLALALLGAGLGALAGVFGTVAAETWDSIRPGESTQAAVLTQFGEPSKRTMVKIEGYDSAQWVYDEKQAPKGMARVTVDFGILTPQGYRPELVRQMLVEPRPGIFTRATVVAGWGEPDVVGTEGEAKVLGYRSGLFVYFDKEGWNAERMYFTPPQPSVQGGAQPQR